MEIYTSTISERLHDYNSGLYYDAPANILDTFLGVDCVGRIVTVAIDKEIELTNSNVGRLYQGHVKEFLDNEGKQQTAYLIEKQELESLYRGVVIAVVQFQEQETDIWIVAGDFHYSKGEIEEMIGNLGEIGRWEVMLRGKL